MTTIDDTMMVVYECHVRDYRNLADAYEAHGLLAEARRCRDLADEAAGAAKLEAWLISSLWKSYLG